MSVLVYASSVDGTFKKSAFEVVSYGKKVAEQLGTEVIALSINASDATTLQNYGATTIVTVNHDQLSTFNAEGFASVIKQVANAKGARVVVVDSSIDGLYLAPLVAVAMNAGYASNVVAAPSSTEPFVVKRHLLQMLSM